MIRFQCKHCGHRMKADDRYAGKRVRCPKCKMPVQIVQSDAAAGPAKPALIKFRCPNCTQKIGLPPEYAGKVVRCAKCKYRIRVPEAPAKAAPPKPKDGLPTLKVAQQPPADESGPAGFGDMSDLLQLEAGAPAVEDPLRLSPMEKTGDAAGASDYAGQFPPRPAYQDIEDPTPKKKSIMVPIIIVAVILVVLLGAGLILVRAVFKTIESIETPVPVDARVEKAREFTEDYIALLAKGDVNTAHELLTTRLKREVEKEQIEKLAEQIGKIEITETAAGPTHIKELVGGRRYYLWYDISYGVDTQTFIVAIVEAENEYVVDGMAAQEPFGKTVEIGQSFEELAYLAKLSVVEPPDVYMAFLERYACTILGIGVTLLLIQVASMYMVFEKCGEPGWLATVPIYNMWVLAEAGNRPGWMGLAWFFSNFIPFIGPIIGAILGVHISIGVAIELGRGVLFGIGLFLLPVIFYPIAAFSGDN